MCVIVLVYIVRRTGKLVFELFADHDIHDLVNILLQQIGTCQLVFVILKGRFECDRFEKMGEKAFPACIILADDIVIRGIQNISKVRACHNP